MTATGATLLLDDVTVHYGGLRALSGVSLEVAAGELVCLLGSNGSGKTTTLRAISGLVKCAGGTVAFGGETITNIGPTATAKRGIAHVPQGRELFGPLSVRDNLELGAYLLSDRERIDAQLAEVYSLFPILEQRAGQQASTLSGGEAQMLAIGRGLMSDPAVLLMDEPSLGVAPKIVDRIYEAIATMHAAGRAILVVEQNPVLALEVSTRAYVLQVGEVVLTGPSSEVRESSRIQSLYLGGVAE